MLNAGLKRTGLLTRPACNKIEWQTGATYNTRWGYKWRNAYFTYLRGGAEHDRVHRPEDSKDVNPIGWSGVQDILYRGWPWLRMVANRVHRVSDKLTKYVLPTSSLVFLQCWDLALGFQVLTVLPLLIMYQRARDKCIDPDFKETYLREIVFEHPEVKAVFHHNHTVVLDYDCEYDKGFLDPKVWPEFQNRLFQFMNTDGTTTSGHFYFADVNTGATLNLKFKTMPICGKYRFQVGEPFHFYDVRGELTTKDGQTKQVVIVDEAEQRNKIKPYLLLY